MVAIIIGMGIVFLGSNPTTSTTFPTASSRSTTTTPEPALCRRSEELWWAVNRGNLTVVETLLKCPNINVNIDTVGEGQRTPLYVASTHGYTEMVRALLQDPRTEVNNCECGASPLIGAAHYGHFELVELLLRCPKTNIEFKGGHKNKSAKQWALDSGHIDVASLISEESRKKLIKESGISCWMKL